jgi:hypothetical protein
MKLATVGVPQRGDRERPRSLRPDRKLAGTPIDREAEFRLTSALRAPSLDSPPT